LDLEDLLVVQDNRIVLHIQVDMQEETDMIHFMPDPQVTASEHLEEVREDRRAILDLPTYRSLDHLEVEVDRVVDLEEEDRNLPQVEV
jgi:hypothetical protein